MRDEQALLLSLIPAADMHGRPPEARNCSKHSPLMNSFILIGALKGAVITTPILQMMKPRHPESQQVRGTPGSGTRQLAVEAASSTQHQACGCMATCLTQVGSSWGLLLTHASVKHSSAGLPHRTPRLTCAGRDNDLGKTFPRDYTPERIYYKLVFCRRRGAT